MSCWISSCDWTTSALVVEQECSCLSWVSHRGCLSIKSKPSTLHGGKWKIKSGWQPSGLVFWWLWKVLCHPWIQPEDSVMLSAFLVVGCPDWRWAVGERWLHDSKRLDRTLQQHAQETETKIHTCCITARAFNYTHHCKGGKQEAALCLQGKVKIIFLQRHFHI